MPAKPAPKASLLRQRLEDRGISVRAVAARLKVNRTHLHRVLNGERPGSDALLDSVAEIAEDMPARRPQEDVHRLIDAATHVFFLKRGDFQSVLFTDPEPWDSAETAVRHPRRHRP